jgi:acyl-CoA reductase-like NAD-dependent aldehyde dehydrogenase
VSVARSTAEDIELALDAAQGEGRLGQNIRRRTFEILNKVADAVESNLDLLAMVETLDNGKPIRETTSCRPAARRRSLPLFCRRDPRTGRLAGNRSRHRRLSLPATRRRRQIIPGTSRC